jgi:hypothetical protein
MVYPILLIFVEELTVLNTIFPFPKFPILTLPPNPPKGPLSKLNKP